MADLELIANALIGEALRRPENFGQLAAELRPEDFPEGIKRSIWSGLCSLFFAGEAIDVGAVLQPMIDVGNALASCRTSSRKEA